MTVRIVTDTSCDLPPTLEKELEGLGVKTVPFLFHFGLEEHQDKTMSMPEFLARSEQTWPTTAAPSAGAFVEAFREDAQAGHQILCITITGKHSATYTSAVLAARQFPPDQVTVIDSKSLSMGQGLLVLAAARAAAAGQSPQQIAAMLRDMQERLQLLITLDSVTYLVKGGRASKLSGILAGLLRIRPILQVIDGELTLADKPRGRQAAKERILSLAESYFPPETVGVIHVACEAEATELVAELSSRTSLSEGQILLAETGMALATHGGPGTLGIAIVSQASR